jgi:hypothetical protein
VYLIWCVRSTRRKTERRSLGVAKKLHCIEI